LLFPKNCSLSLGLPCREQKEKNESTFSLSLITLCALSSTTKELQKDTHVSTIFLLPLSLCQEQERRKKNADTYNTLSYPFTQIFFRKDFSYFFLVFSPHSVLSMCLFGFFFALLLLIWSMYLYTV
jgi:hypothetical protein